MTQRDGRMRFGAGEWLALGAAMLSLIGWGYRLDNRAAATEAAVARVERGLDVVSDELKGLIRVDERVRGLEQRIEQLERRNVARHGEVPLSDARPHTGGGGHPPAWVLRRGPGAQRGPWQSRFSCVVGDFGDATTTPGARGWPRNAA